MMGCSSSSPASVKRSGSAMIGCERLILVQLTPHRRTELGLGMARRLAAIPDLFAVAAEQYLQVLDALDRCR